MRSFVPPEELDAICVQDAANASISGADGVTLMHRRHGHRLLRAVRDGRSYVVKCFSSVADANEISAYRLLQELGVPTLPVHGSSDTALALEDLNASSEWRLATEQDVLDAETGRVVAAWYRSFHKAGRRLLSGSDPIPGFLEREADHLSAASIMETGSRLGLETNPVWRVAAESVDALRSAMAAMPETLNYNDFYWTNLALSRDGRRQLEAIVFDYHLLGIGPAYSDCRNVVGSLGPDAASAFWEVYGPVDEREAILDEPMSVLYGLWAAAQRSRLPSWAEELVARAQGGQLEASLRSALQVL